MISLICHDITTDNYTKTMFWIRTCQINAPDSRLQMILTKVDKLSPQERSSKKEAFVKEITDLLQKEIMTALPDRNKDQPNALPSNSLTDNG